MESLALLVVTLMLMALLSGPVAIGLSAIKSDSAVTNIIRRIFHAPFVLISLWVGVFFCNPEMPLVANLIGLYAIVMGYIALRREYFPHVRIISPLLVRLGIKSRAIYEIEDELNPDSIETQPVKKSTSSLFGPIMKWHRNGRSGGNDGHGPKGQH
jgi:hypothetical protein